MAVITLSVPAGEIRGSLGATSFRGHRGKTVVLRKPTQRSGAGRATLTQRRLLAELLRTFSGLSTAQQNLWISAWQMNRFAGGIEFQRQFPSVQTLYVHQVMPISLAGSPFTVVIPTAPGRAKPPTPIFYQSLTWQIAYNFASDPLLANQHMILAISRMCPASRTNFRTWTALIGYKTGPYSSGYGWSVPQLGAVGMQWQITAIRFDGTTNKALLHSNPIVQNLTKTF